MRTLEELMEIGKGADGRNKLLTIKATVETSDTKDEKLREDYLSDINIALNGGIKYTHKDVLEDIKAGEADISDIGGMN